MLIQPYNQEWPSRFDEIEAELLDVLDGLVLRIEHVGSTSVPDLAAKDIIDIDIVYDRKASLSGIIEALATVGYKHIGEHGIPLRDAFKRLLLPEVHPVLDRITHHLYACPAHSPELKRHLTFRDHLRNTPAAREEYARLKREIAEDANQDKKAYAVLKESRARDFIDDISGKKADRE